ncbi:MAG: hypothetical protein ABI919_00720 [Ramlibacter sp.]
MAKQAAPIPPEVLAAVRSGNGFEAIKLLRKSGVGLKDAKAWLDAHGAELMAAAETAGAKKRMPRQGNEPAGPAIPRYDPMAPLPAEVVEAIRNKQSVQAILLMRQLTGAGLKEAKDAVESYQLASGATVGGLSPGQVGSAGGTAWRWIIIALAAGAIYFYFR